ATGGPALAVRTVEQLSAVRVDHVALIDSATFDRVTESLGGVDIDVPSAVVIDGRTVVPAGRQHLTGEQARIWVHGAGEPEDEEDADRIVRERAWLAAILARLGDDDVRRDPIAWLALLGVVTDSVAVDEGLDQAQLTGLLTSLRALHPDDVDVVAAPTTLTRAGQGGAGRVELVPDPAPFEAMMAALRTDTLGEVLASGG
ncbi:MAG: LytR family transcriptional regulator, partial [Cellulomonadaceae bacterium]|nr:LytR family transcriptional regulator [Cellulomonadaceae bacterium]